MKWMWFGDEAKNNLNVQWLPCGSFRNKANYIIDLIALMWLMFSLLTRDSNLKLSSSKTLLMLTVNVIPWVQQNQSSGNTATQSK